jgi:hypothetical protein
MDALSILRKVTAGPRRATQLVAKNVQRGVEAVNPWDAQSRGAAMIDTTARQYGITPAFKQLLASQNPSAVTGSLGGSNALEQGHTQAANYKPVAHFDPLHRISVSTQNRNQNSNNRSLLHEGLHAAWDTQPQKKAEFIKAYNAGATPTMRAYLINRTEGYKTAIGQATAGGYLDLNKATPELQTEIHSYVPEYLEKYGNPAEVPALSQYYSQFYDVNRPRAYKQEVNTVKRSVQSMIGDRKPLPRTLNIGTPRKRT